MKRVTTVFGLLCLVIFLNACSSSGSTQMVKQKSAPIPPGSTVSLSVKATLPNDADADAREDSAKVTHRLRSQLFCRLVSEAVFKQVLQPGEQADYRMDVMLQKAEEVSQGARVLLGALAGSNSLTVSVTLHEEPSDVLVTAFEVAGESAAHPLSSEDDLDDAIREAVDEIVLALQ